MPNKPSISDNHEYEIAILRERNSLLNILSEFAIALLRLRTKEDVLWYATNEVVGQMGFDDCVIYLWDANSQLLVQQSAFGHKTMEQGAVNNALHLRLGEGIVGRAALKRETIVVNDVSIDDSYVVDMQQSGSELAIPIIYADQLIGVIDSENLAKNFYTAEHIKILTAVTSMVAAKLAQTNLIQQLESSISELEYAKKLQSVLFNIAALTYEDENFFKVYEKIHHLITELLYAKSFFVAVYNEETRRIEFPYFVDERHPNLAADIGPVDTEMRGMSAWVIFNNSSLLLSRQDIIERSQRGDFELLGTLAESWLGVPIHAGDDLKGALVVQTYSPLVSYMEKDKELLSFVSRHVSNLLKRKVTEKKLQHLALHDALTGLANRTLFLDRVSHALKKQERQDQRICAVLYMDVDLFKSVNDRYGHAVGDALLTQFAHLLSEQTRQLDTVARLGGDEFALFLEDIDSQETAIQLAKRIIQALQEPLAANEVMIACSTSIGIAYTNDSSITAIEIIRRADAAMYQAKAAGRGHYQLYDPLLDRANVRDLVLGEDIQIALTEEQFVLHYQPVIDVKSGIAVGFEALIRWQHPTKSWIAPNEFIDYAEKHRLIEKIDRYVLRQALQQMTIWRQQTGLSPKVSVNISGRHFASAEFISTVLALLDEFQIAPHTLGIEITERAVIDKFAIAQNNIQILQKNHVRILLDDFGTGYSSLNYLHQLTLDVIKIDRTFVKGSRGSKPNNPIINSIVALAAAMNLSVVAEGVETLDELLVLREAGCELCQGFYFSKALPPEAAIAYFLAHHTQVQVSI
ncbi:EAL domain-containing protein [Undibacterium seohonense]|uniref:EAL domain-containing protein n=1 Tax=Undibacterium seohonense TaxID=1344950 RepID=A0ABR6X6R1_9BURK|nr:EAL domain-containing protein [Undibacterium seohonense]MBC3808328.1 EAL domain-containing protein [Undibacterium seohonense]